MTGLSKKPLETLFCDRCDYSCRGKQQLQQHFEVKHLGVKHSCTFCEFSATTKQVLKWHITSKHGEGYRCHYCDYNATQPSQLKQHILAVHEKVKYPCDQCNFSTSFKTNLSHHKKKEHGYKQQSDDIADNRNHVELELC